MRRLAALLIGLPLALGVYARAQSPHGAAAISAEPAQCAAANTIQLWTVTTGGKQPPPGPTETMASDTQFGPDGAPLPIHVTFIEGRAMTPDCRWTFGDLPPGDYVAVLTRQDGSGGSQTFSVIDGQTTTAAIPAPVVTLSGRVFRAGAPAAGAEVRIVTVPFSRPSILVVANSAGEYTALLDRPGSYEVSANDGDVVPTTLKTGANVVYLVAR